MIFKISGTRGAVSAARSRHESAGKQALGLLASIALSSCLQWHDIDGWEIVNGKNLGNVTCNTMEHIKMIKDKMITGNIFYEDVGRLSH